MARGLLDFLTFKRFFGNVGTSKCYSPVTLCNTAVSGCHSSLVTCHRPMASPIADAVFSRVEWV